LINFFAIEYSLYTSAPVADRQRGLKIVELGPQENRHQANHNAAAKLAATIFRMDYLAKGDRRWLILDQTEYNNLLLECQ